MHFRIDNRREFRIAFVAAMVTITVFLGCSEKTSRPKLVAVSGTVKFKGAPVASAVVTFVPDGSSPRYPSGMTDKDGNFRLTSYDTNDGAPVGEYTVAIVPGRATDGKKPEQRNANDLIALGPGGAIEPEATFPQKYADSKTSGLKRSVVAGDKNVFNFDLDE